MARVKMNAKHEYEFIANYKVMQNVFKAKKIDKARLGFSPISLYFAYKVHLFNSGVDVACVIYSLYLSRSL
jgi:hypothetical protein